MSIREHQDPQDAGEEAAMRRVWQQVSDESPPAELDAAITAAARRSVLDGTEAGVGRQPRRRWMQWQPLAAAATVAGLAFILLQVMPRERDVTPSIRIEDSARAPATARPGAATPPVVDRAEPNRAAEESAETNGAAVEPAESNRAEVEPGPAEAAASPPTYRAEADQAAAQSSESAVVEQRTFGQMARESVDSAATAVAPAPAKLQRGAATRSAADWAAEIVALYDSGDSAAAADMLRAFRAAEPDADTHLPHSMRDWARSVQ